MQPNMRNVCFICLLGLQKKQFDFNKLLDSKPEINSVEFMQACNPSNKYRLTVENNFCFCGKLVIFVKGLWGGRKDRPCCQI